MSNSTYLIIEIHYDNKTKKYFVESNNIQKKIETILSLNPKIRFIILHEKQSDTYFHWDFKKYWQKN